MGMYLCVALYSFWFISLLCDSVGGLKLSANEELGASRIFGLGVIGDCSLSDELFKRESEEGYSTEWTVFSFMQVVLRIALDSYKSRSFPPWG